MALYDTVANVVSDTAVELGLGTVSDVYGSTDGNVVQLRTLLKRVGRNLARLHPWKQLLKEHNFSGLSVYIDGVSFDLPSDYGAFVDQTEWNRTGSTPILVTSPQSWQRLKASGATSTVMAQFRMTDLKLKFSEVQSATDTFYFEYLSRWWVGADGETTGDKDAPTANTDALLFEPYLLIPALKVAWLQAKGFDSTAAQNEYAEALMTAKSANVGAAPVLSLSHSGDVPLIGGHNVPETGFGD